MTQEQIEQLTEEEYSYFLAHGEPKRTEDIASIAVDVYDNHSHFHTDGDCFWNASLDSTTNADMTFGYKDTHYMSTLV